jgi:integrase
LKFNDRSARAVELPSGVADKTFFDGDLGGFGVRVRASGARSWVVQYDFGGKTNKMTLGTIDDLAAAKARAIAKDIFAGVRLGRNPAVEKRLAKAAVVETFGALLPRYLGHKRVELKRRSYEEVERHLTLHCKSLHGRPVANIDLRAVAILLADIAERSGPNAANAVRVSGSAFFNWLIGEGVVEVNPFARANKAAVAGARERTPTDDELREIWRACPDGDYGAILRLCILVGARKSEIADLSWSEIDFDNALITIPARRMKNRRDHEIPLSAPAFTLLKGLPRRDGRDLVFGRGDRGFSGWSKAKRELDERIAAARLTVKKKGKVEAMPAWCLHDLRRSLSTTMHERLGVAPHVVEEVLSHLTFKEGIRGAYNTARYRAEKRAALSIWAEHVMAVVEGRANPVVPLRRA